MKVIKILLIVTILLSVNSYATEVKFGVFNFRPWGMQVENEVTGMIWDQALAIFKSSDHSISAVISSYPRMIKSLKTGELDCAIITKNNKNSDTLDFVSHVHDLEVIVISKVGVKVDRYSDFIFPDRKAIVGFANGTAHLYPQLYNDPRITAHIVPKMKQGPLMLSRERIDFFVGVSASLLYEIRKTQLFEKINYPGFLVTTLEVWLQCSKKSSLTEIDYQQLRTKITQLKIKNTFTRIINKWIPPVIKPQ